MTGYCQRKLPLQKSVTFSHYRISHFSYRAVAKAQFSMATAKEQFLRGSKKIFAQPARKSLSDNQAQFSKSIAKSAYSMDNYSVFAVKQVGQITGGGAKGRQGERRDTRTG